MTLHQAAPVMRVCIIPCVMRLEIWLPGMTGSCIVAWFKAWSEVLLLASQQLQIADARH